VSKVYQEYNLENDEEKSSDRSNHHTYCGKDQLFTRDEKETNDNSNANQPLEEPKSVLYVGPGIFAAVNTQHHQHLNEKERSDAHTDPVN
jgi:hypothetical protein